jgi:hypothetical protein
MEALDEMDLTTRLSSVAKEYWVHLDADGSFEKYPGKYPHKCDARLLIVSCSETTCSPCSGKVGNR